MIVLQNHEESGAGSGTQLRPSALLIAVYCKRRGVHSPGASSSGQHAVTSCRTGTLLLTWLTISHTSGFEFVWGQWHRCVTS